METSVFTIPPILSHVAVEGWSDIANGAIHPFVNPAQILVLLGVALLLGRQVPLLLRHPVITFAVATASGLGLTLAGISLAANVPVLAGIALCLGGLIAAGFALPEKFLCVICAAAGLLLGLDSAAESGTALVIAKTLAGTWFGLNIATLYLALASSNATGRPWAVTGIRVLGSWLVAIALLVLAFALRTPPR